MSKEVQIGGRGIGLPGALFVAFVVLKLTGVIDWSWWWVAAPLWIGWAIAGAFMILALLLVAIADSKPRRRRKL